MRNLSRVALKINLTFVEVFQVKLYNIIQVYIPFCFYFLYFMCDLFYIPLLHTYPLVLIRLAKSVLISIILTI